MTNNIAPFTIAPTHLVEQKFSNAIIYKGEFSLEAGKAIFKIDGEIFYSLASGPKLICRGQIIDREKYFTFDMIEQWDLLIDYRVVGKVQTTTMKIESKKEKSEQFFEGVFQYEAIFHENVKAKEIFFSVVNFINNDGQAILHENILYRGRIEVEFQEYVLTLDKRPNSKAVFERLKRSNGFEVTHVGKIKRIDKQQVVLQEIEGLLDKITLILSFAAGRQVGINHIFYYSKDEINITHYRTPRIEAWKKINNWFPENSSRSLKCILTRLLILMESEYWERQIRLLLSSYFDGLGPSYIENKIMIIQTALETLSYAYLVEESRKLSENEFKRRGVPASKKIKRLLTEFNINYSIKNIADLRELSNQFEDGPHLFTHIRNQIAHPRKNPENLNPNEWYYVWRIGIVYFELSILAIAAYDGEYKDLLLEPALEAEMTRQVPWVT